MRVFESCHQQYGAQKWHTHFSVRLVKKDGTLIPWKMIRKCSSYKVMKPILKGPTFWKNWLKRLGKKKSPVATIETRTEHKIKIAKFSYDDLIIKDR